MKMDVEVGVYLGVARESSGGEYNQNTLHEIFEELLQIIFRQRGERVTLWVLSPKREISVMSPTQGSEVIVEERVEDCKNQRLWTNVQQCFLEITEQLQESPEAETECDSLNVIGSRQLVGSSTIRW